MSKFVEVTFLAREQGTKCIILSSLKVLVHFVVELACSLELYTIHIEVERPTKRAKSNTYRFTNRLPSIITSLTKPESFL
jgi:hypothetical protein